jgi:putative acetyltransferase
MHKRRIDVMDDRRIAQIIRQVLEEFGAAREGTVYTDETTDHLSKVFLKEGSAYWVAEENGIVSGGAGIYPTDGLDEDTCELVKMYLLPEFRGKGLGQSLLDRCIAFAIESGYRKCYIETMPELKGAIQLYLKNGFLPLNAPLGNSGHHGCSMWFIKDL